MGFVQACIRYKQAGREKKMKLGDFDVGDDAPVFFIAGPCVVESEAVVMKVAEHLKRIGEELDVNVVFKASFDKANRTSLGSFRGLGMAEGLRILSQVREQLSLLVLTDVHEDTPLSEVSAVADILQTPAFLCRQTNFIQNVARQGKPVNLKKGTFLSPQEMRPVVDKARATGNEQLMVCERGYCFGYNNLISDMRSLEIMRETECPVVFDATHSVQLPGGLGGSSGGQKQFVLALAKAACAVGVDGVFMETHPCPEEALSDGPNAVPLSELKNVISQLKAIDMCVRSFVS